MSGRSLGLQVSVRPVIDSSPNYSERFYLGTNFHADGYYMDDQDDDEVLMRGLEIQNDDNITWCQKGKQFYPLQHMQRMCMQHMTCSTLVLQ